MKLINDEEKSIFMNLEKEIIKEIPEIFFDEKLTSTWIQDYSYPNKNKLLEFKKKLNELKNKGINLLKEKDINSAKVIFSKLSNKENHGNFFLYDINKIKESIEDLCLIDRKIIQIDAIEYLIGEKKFKFIFYINKKSNNYIKHSFTFVMGKTQKYIENHFKHKNEMLIKEIYLSYLKNNSKDKDDIYKQLRDCKKEDILDLVSLINIIDY